jgi:Chemotaxis phosphatase CheX
MNEEIVSKVLVLDSSPDHAGPIKRFCEENNLVGLKVSKSRLMSVLRTNIDLGGILYSETFGGSPEESAEIALMIHAARPELPIIVRRESEAALAGLPDGLRRIACAAYITSDMAALRKVIDQYIFSLMYPNALVRGIVEITQAVLGSQFRTLAIGSETPYIVHDRLIFGELFSLIPLESAWCRGYMMLQTEEAPLLDLLGRDPETGGGAGFRAVNNLLGEVTNLIWGSFKNCYFGAAGAMTDLQIQVPLVINHKHRYISFGTENPQLRFRFTLADTVTGRVVKLDQSFVFNLSWSPEDFKEFDRFAGGIGAAGELELF